MLRLIAGRGWGDIEEGVKYRKKKMNISVYRKKSVKSRDLETKKGESRPPPHLGFLETYFSPPTH